MKKFPKAVLIYSILVYACSDRDSNDFQSKAISLPNVIIILADDLGYGDLGCQGHPLIKTPNIDRLASEGQRWTSFYASYFACNPSRAALLTGRLPYRIHEGKSLWASVPSREVTIAELLRKKGYKSACIGKWHLGMDNGEHPNDQGFDYFYGLAGSNDAPIKEGSGFERTYENIRNAPFDVFDIQLFRQKESIEDVVKQDLLTSRYTQEAVKWINENGDEPFFLYVPHSMPHVPIYASNKFQGKSKAGLYGDVIEELDWSVGKIIKALEEKNIAEKTLVIFTSDNGPWITYYDLGGSPGHLRDGKLTAWEGGQRVPAIFWWPGKISPAVVDAISANVDFMATLSTIIGFTPPNDRDYDSYDLSQTLLYGKSGARDQWFYYGPKEQGGDGGEVWAARMGKYKAHYYSRHSIGSEKDGFWRGYSKQNQYDPVALFDLNTDIGERFNVAEKYPEIIAIINKIVNDHK